MFTQWCWPDTKDLGFRWQILQIDQNAVILKQQEISWQLTNGTSCKIEWTVFQIQQNSAKLWSTPFSLNPVSTFMKEKEKKNQKTFAERSDDFIYLQIENLSCFTYSKKRNSTTIKKKQKFFN